MTTAVPKYKPLTMILHRRRALKLWQWQSIAFGGLEEGRRQKEGRVESASQQKI